MLKSNILKLALFATGLSGIVAEYMLSTMATYFIGDSVFHWTMIISTMLFAMGLGSRLTRLISGSLLAWFVGLELSLSLFVGFSSILVYIGSVFTEYTPIIIYGLSIIIGLFIGMEIPLVMRLNSEFEDLKVNVSSAVEKDYYGSLVGGVFFAFVGLPVLGLTYTPFLLAGVNLAVAIVLIFFLKSNLSKIAFKRSIAVSLLLLMTLILGSIYAQPVVLYGEQVKYKDQVVYSEQSKYQKIILTQWKDHYWLYLNGHQQLSSMDEVMYHEPIVHFPVMLNKHASKVLVLGGGDGCAVRELLKYKDIEQIDLVDLDPSVTDLAKTHEVLLSLNKGALSDARVNVYNDDGYRFIKDSKDFYDVIIIDLPDPKTVELSRLYSYEFYKLCHRQLRPHGTIITQAGSPYFATKAYLCINESMSQAGFSTMRVHNQLITLGEWGWILGSKDEEISQSLLEDRFNEDISTEWMNKESIQLMTSFGKEIYPGTDTTHRVNKIHDPVLYQYYLEGNWDLY